LSEYTNTNTITSIAIGSFDGLHVAHRKLIDQAEGVVVIERDRGYLTPGFKRSWYTDKPLFFYRFEKIQGWSAAEFVAQLRKDFPRLERIVVGYDFGFGQGREGDAAHLRKLFDGEVVIVDEVRVDGVSVHSRVIREYLREGDIGMANRLLGREYLLDGEVIAGQGLGGRELVPTPGRRLSAACRRGLCDPHAGGGGMVSQRKLPRAPGEHRRDVRGGEPCA